MKAGRAHRDLAAGIHHERIAVEDQLVLAAEQIDENHGNAGFGHAPADFDLALNLLVDLVGGGVDHQQYLGAGTARLTRGLRLPDVLAHRIPALIPFSSTTVGLVPGVK